MVAAALLMGQGSRSSGRRIVDAEVFRLVQGDKVRAVLGNDKGVATLTFLDQDGNPRTSMVTNQFGEGVLLFFDSSRQVRLATCTAAGGKGVSTQFADGKGRARMRLSVHARHRIRWATDRFDALREARSLGGPVGHVDAPTARR
jgi:hypothetical protein